MRACMIFFSLLLSALHANPFTLFTEPKTGTHLLIPILESLTHQKVYWAKKLQQQVDPSPQALDLANSELFYFSIDQPPWSRDLMEQVWSINEKNKTFLHLHAPYSPAMERYLLDKQCINFFIKRDPRDRIVSLLNHYRYIRLNDPSLESVSSDEERLLLMIRKGLRRSTLHFMGWITSPASVVLDFSKLMGSHGGFASQEDALGEMRKIAQALQICLSDEALEKIYRDSFGQGWNFFKGKVNVWKDYFKEEHKQAAKEEIGDLLIELGYEKDLNW